MRKEGFYKVKVQELGSPFWTIGLWNEGCTTDGYWQFADGDGDEFGSSFTILEIDENLIFTHRDYENI